MNQTLSLVGLIALSAGSIGLFPSLASAKVEPDSGADLFGDESLPLTGPKLSDPGLQAVLQWNMAMPVFETYEFTGRYSFRGISLSGRYRVWPDFSFGASGAWQVFDVKETTTVKVDNLTITGTQVRHTNTVPLLAEAHYYLPFSLGEQRLESYFGLGFGAYYVERRLDLGVTLSYVDTSWHVGVAPELGLMVPLEVLCFVASVKWHFVQETDEVPWQSYFNFNLGFNFY